MNKLLSFLLLFGTTSLLGQYQYQRLNHIRSLRNAAPLYNKQVDLHTSVQPLDAWEMDSVISAGSEGWQEALSFGYKKWLWRKAFQEHLIDVKGRNFWFTADPVVNFQLGVERDLMYVNTRGFNLEGRLGNKFSFSTSFLENQAIFPQYVSDFISYRNVVPGQGIQRPFGSKGFDYGIASGEVTYTPDEIFSVTLGQGRNFFGEGYRSVFLSDGAFNYPFLRVETTFWKVKYTNLWAQLYDVRPQAQVATNGAYAKKYLSSHYLSINVTPRWNISFFEAIIIGDTAQQKGIDISFFNPVIFYRPVEFATGSRSGNAHIGLATSYKLADGIQTYGQFLLDEFTLDDLTAGNGSWVNKFAWQWGIKHYNTFGIKGLFTRLEYNGARPYTFSHRNALTNYGHYGQPLAHPWGANFHEGLLQAVYQLKRWEFECRIHMGQMGLDTNGSDWGSDIYQPYGNRELEEGNVVGQGVDGQYLYTLLRLGWLINPATGLKVEAGAQIRNLTTPSTTTPFAGGSSQYVFVGLRTGFFNTYYDF
jgi:hypothetical protein